MLDISYLDGDGLTHYSIVDVEAREWLSNHVEYKQILEQLLRNLVDSLKKNDRDDMFFKKVTDDKVPGYSNIVKQPICLKTIQNKVKKSHYMTFEEFKKDVSIFTDCYISIRFGYCLIYCEPFICRCISCLETASSLPVMLKKRNNKEGCSRRNTWMPIMSLKSAWISHLR